MSNRPVHNNNTRQTGTKSNFKSQKKYIPKTNPTNATTTDPTLTSSLRHSLATAAAASSPATSRVTHGDIGDSVSGAGSFVNYLPQDEAVAAGLGVEDGGSDPTESQRVVDLLNRELSRLLKLSPRDFWREVASDTSLHEFLDTFLQYRSRWYDFPQHGANGIVAGVIVGEFELSRRVFMVLYRISSNRDPGARATDSLSLHDHGVLLQEKKLLDLPKLLDICAIYGRENEELTKSLVVNALKSQPKIHDNLTEVITHFSNIVHTMHQRCSSTLETLFSSEGHEDHGFSWLHKDFLEVMDFINDAVVAMDAFVGVYKPAAVFFSCPGEMSFGNEEVLNNLSRLHDSLLPSLQRGFRVIFSGGKDGLHDKSNAMLSNVSISLKMLSARIVKFAWKLLDSCYLSEEVFQGSNPLPPAIKMFPANVEDPVIRADILVQTFRDINGISQESHENLSRRTFLQNVEKNHRVMERLQSLISTGWIFMDDEQFQYLSGIMIDPLKPATIKQPSSVPSSTTPSNKLQMDEDIAITESKISQIKDLFPDYGKGFLSACLEVYNHDPEEVIQRILEGTLHEDLLSLDTSLENIPTPKPPPPKAASSSLTNDKGKGKLVESTAPPPSSKAVAREQSSEVGPSVSSSSLVGRFVRKSRNDSPYSQTLDSNDSKQSAKTAALISQYEYEDEYDDSFDDLGLSVVGSGLEETELLRESVRGVKTNPGNSWASENGRSNPNPSNASKWGSRKKPQFFVKDGKNYSYKVADSVAVANSDEATLVNQAQKELIHGLGRGGNFPLGAVQKIVEGNEEQNNQSDVPEMGGRGNSGNYRGRGRRGGGGRNNNYRKDQAMKKHFSGLSGF